MRRVTILAAALLLAACGSGSSRAVPPPSGPLPMGTLSITTDGGGAKLSVEVAATEPARRYGLMNRRSLAADAGMAFVFDEPVSGGFWMKDTLLPLSIAFWGPDHRIIAVMEMTPCRSDPCPIYQPPGRYVGAGEANRHWFRDHGVGVGDRVLLIQTP